ncbi:MAG TPA: alcohol dehydrogenase catalytic domain-containing protein [Anaerolineales bacterium]|nr:alcohol dehydrogenase catalytic domain-containing protein [Anaerolineales bacterium]
MKAALLYGKEDIRLEQASLPEMESEGLLIRVLTCGICGSDSRMFFNGPTARYINPVILGHEICGEVVEVGPGITDYRAGDLVGIAPIIPCMHCHACSHGQDNICATAKVIGCNVHGAMGEFMYIPSQMVQVGGAVKLPAGASHREAALAELVGCVRHGLRQVGIEAGDQVLVIGGGPIGATFVQLARLMGAKVTSSELLPRRRELAMEMGAVEAVDPAAVDLKSRYGYAFDRVIVATASLPATQQACDLARAGGSLLFFSGYLKGATLDLQLNDVHYRELHLHGSIDCTIQDYQNAISLLPQLRMGELITDVFSLGQTAEAFYATRNPEAIKVAIEP